MIERTETARVTQEQLKDLIYRIAYKICYTLLGRLSQHDEETFTALAEQYAQGITDAIQYEFIMPPFEEIELREHVFPIQERVMQKILLIGWADPTSRKIFTESAFNDWKAELEGSVS